jgi:hypothetical protein
VTPLRIDLSEVTSLLIDIFQAKKNDVGSLACYRPCQLSRIDAIARIQWNWQYSPKPEDRHDTVTWRSSRRLPTGRQCVSPTQRSRGQL